MYTNKNKLPVRSVVQQYDPCHLIGVNHTPYLHLKHK